MWKTILDLFFPINCLGCGREGQFICPACLRKIPLNQKTLFRFNQAWPLTGLIAAGDYSHPLIKEAIHRHKYDLVKDLAGPLGGLMTKKLTSTKEFAFLKQRVAIEAQSPKATVRKGDPLFQKMSLKNIVLIPIPLHPKRLRWRGFNQAELLAQVVSQQLGIPLAENVLRRVKYRLPQMAIKSSQQRKDNIKGAFELTERGRASRFQVKGVHQDSTKGCSFGLRPLRSKGHIRKGDPWQDRVRKTYPPKALKNKTIILIDDVATTGATLTECARVLKPLRPKEIWGLVIAHG